MIRLKGKNYKYIKASNPQDYEFTCESCEYISTNYNNCDIDEMMETPPCSIKGGSHILIEIKLKRLLKQL